VWVLLVSASEPLIGVSGLKHLFDSVGLINQAINLNFLFVPSGWSGVGSIIASWVVSPICAGIVTAIVLFITQQLVLKSDNSFKRGLIALPFYFFVTLAINVFYIVYKGSPGLNLSKLPLGTVFGITFGISGGIFLFCWFFLKPFLKRRLGDDEPLKWYHVFFIPLVSKREKAEVEAPSIEVATEHGPDSIQDATNEKTDESQEEYIATEEENAPGNTDSNDGQNKPKKFLKKGLDRFKAKMKRGIEDDTQDEKLQQIHDNAQKYENRTERLFSVLQVMTACFASFAHGSNDVANAVGPVSCLF
jgi:phosphate/sulfate permease